VLRWYYLGVSLASLLPLPSDTPFVRAVLQLLEEHQYHFASSAERSIKAIRARPAVKLSAAGAEDGSLNVALVRVNGKVLYEYLLTPHVAHALSGAQVALSLSDLLTKLYRKLSECAAAAGPSPAVGEAIAKLDGLLELNVIEPVVKHAEGRAREALRGHLGRLDPLFARMMGHADGSAANDEMEATPAGSGAPAVTGAL